MCYIYDTKTGKVKRVAVPVLKTKLKQTKDMKLYLDRIRNLYKNVDWDKIVNEKVNLQKAKV